MFRFRSPGSELNRVDGVSRLRSGGFLLLLGGVLVARFLIDLWAERRLKQSSS